MMRHMHLIVLSILTLTPAVANASKQASVGLVTTLIGQATITHEGEHISAPVTANTKISLGDTITTLTDKSFVRIDFIDKTHISLSDEGAELTIDEYIFDPTNLNTNTAQFTILRGSFEFVGGLLDKGEQENVQINLDFGSIGVRGTHIHRTMENDECWIFLEDGEIRVFNGGGSVFLTPGQGTKIRSLTTSPTPAINWSQENIELIKSKTRK